MLSSEIVPVVVILCFILFLILVMIYCACAKYFGERFRRLFGLNTTPSRRSRRTQRGQRRIRSTPAVPRQNQLAFVPVFQPRPSFRSPVRPPAPPSLSEQTSSDISPSRYGHTITLSDQLSTGSSPGRWIGGRYSDDQDRLSSRSVPVRRSGIQTFDYSPIRHAVTSLSDRYPYARSFSERQSTAASTSDRGSQGSSPERRPHSAGSNRPQRSSPDRRPSAHTASDRDSQSSPESRPHSAGSNRPQRSSPDRRPSAHSVIDRGSEGSSSLRWIEGSPMSDKFSPLTSSVKQRARSLSERISPNNTTVWYAVTSLSDKLPEEHLPEWHDDISEASGSIDLQESSSFGQHNPTAQLSEGQASSERFSERQYDSDPVRDQGLQGSSLVQRAVRSSGGQASSEMEAPHVNVPSVRDRDPPGNCQVGQDVLPSSEGSASGEIRDVIPAPRDQIPPERRCVASVLIPTSSTESSDEKSPELRRRVSSEDSSRGSSEPDQVDSSKNT